MYEEETPTGQVDLADRALAGLLAAVAMGGTVILGPVIVIALTKGVAGKAIVFALLSHPALFLIGLTVFVIVGLIAGLALGTTRTISMLGHLWFTERPANTLISCTFWAGLAIVWWLAYMEALHTI